MPKDLPAVAHGIACAYRDMRQACIDMEALIEAQAGLSEQDLKRLDKAVTVMKVSFKLVKQVLRRHGLRGMKPKKSGAAPLRAVA